MLVRARLHHTFRSEASDKNIGVACKALPFRRTPTRATGQSASPASISEAALRFGFLGASRVLGLEPGSGFIGGARLPHCPLAPAPRRCQLFRSQGGGVAATGSPEAVESSGVPELSFRWSQTTAALSLRSTAPHPLGGP